MCTLSNINILRNAVYVIIFSTGGNSALFRFLRSYTLLL